MDNQQGQPPQWPSQSGPPPNWSLQNQGRGSPQQPPQQRQPQPNTPYPPQSYQPPPQYYHQQPYYQQPPMPPPKKKSRAWLWIVLGVAGVLLCSCIGFAAVSASQQKATSTITAPADTQSTGATQAQPNTIRKPVVVNADWTVTLNNVSTSQGTQLDQPKAGHILLVVNVTLKNTSSAVQKASTLAQWALKDSTGQTYNQDILFGAGPDGTVGAGSVIRGNIAYEVPTSAHSFTLQFVPDIGSSDLAEWNVSI